MKNILKNKHVYLKRCKYLEASYQKRMEEIKQKQMRKNNEAFSKRQYWSISEIGKNNCYEIIEHCELYKKEEK